MASVDPPEAQTAHEEDDHVRAGIRYIWRTPTVRAALGATATINFLNFMFWALFVLFATRAGVAPELLASCSEQPPSAG